MKTSQANTTRISKLAAVFLLSAAIIGCDDDDSNSSTSNRSNEEAAPSAMIRVVHASPNAPAVNIQLNDQNAIENLDYAQSTGYVTIPTGTYNIDVDGIIPGGLAESVINVDGAAFSEDSKTNIIAGGLLADIAPIVFASSTAVPSDNQVGVQVVHAAPAAANVDVYLTAPAADINAIGPNFTFNFTDNIDAGVIPIGTYQIRIAAPGTDTVVFDSGEIDLTPFAGSSLLIAAINTTNSIQKNSSPVKLLVATDNNHLIINDTNTQAGLRVVHASPDANALAGGPVEVFATATPLGNAPVELIDAFSYTDIVPNASSHVSVPSGDYTVDVAPDTDTIIDAVFTSSSLGLEAGIEYTAIASNRVAGAPEFGLLISEESARSIATHASVRVIHAAPAAGNVDVYVTTNGAFTADEVVAGMAGEPTLANFALGTITDFLALTPAAYDIRVLAGGVVAINVENVSLTGGSISTIIARGPEEPADTVTDFGVMVINNL